jgi:ankyrin repeat protein
MADLFIIKERLKFSLKLAAVGVGLGLLATWHFWRQLEFDADRSRFLLSAVVTGGLVLGLLGLLLFYIAAKQVVDPSKNLTDRFDSLPWWVFKIVVLLLAIGVMGFFIHRFSISSENEFDLLRKGKTALLKQRIEANPSLLKKKDLKEGVTLIQTAYREGDHAAVAVLLENGAEIEGMDLQGRNPVILSMGNLPMLEVLLKGGGDAELTDAEGIPPIHYAVEQHAGTALSMLLEAGAKIDARDPLFRTPLLRAVENDDLSTAETLIGLGAGVNEYDRRGDTALHKAARRRNTESIRMLLSNGADPRIFNFAQMTPLHLVTIGGHNDLVSIFLELPDMTGLHGENDMTGLHGENDLTPLDHALKGRKYETADLLIEKGADINRIQANGDTLLHQTILARDYRTARFLIRAGGDIRIPNAKGETAYDIMRRKQLNGLLDLVDAESESYEVNMTNTVEAIEVN